MSWKNYEDESYIYLTKKYGKYAEFIKKGGSDSTVSDILVKTKKDSFYIEIKSPKAQSGEFVLLINKKEKKFYFSDKNKSIKNDITNAIIKYMNENWDKYKNVNKTGLDINMNNNLFADWITKYYKSKNVKYFISGNINDFKLIPIDNFAESFNISANYRRKRSGTRQLPQKYKEEVNSYFKNIFNTTDIFKIKNHYYLHETESLNKKLNSDGNYFYNVNGIESTLYLTKYNNKYRVSVRSNTNNPNIIFKIELKNKIKYIDEKTFISKIN